MKRKIGFLPSKRGSDPEIWQQVIEEYEYQKKDWTLFTEYESFIEFVLAIPKTWKELKEEYLHTNISREQYVERCRRNKNSLGLFLEEQVIHRAEEKPAYLDEENKWKIPALIEFIQGFIDDYNREIERESLFVSKNESDTCPEQPAQFGNLGMQLTKVYTRYSIPMHVQLSGGSARI